MLEIVTSAEPVEQVSAAQPLPNITQMIAPEGRHQDS